MPEARPGLPRIARIRIRYEKIRFILEWCPCHLFATQSSPARPWSCAVGPHPKKSRIIPRQSPLARPEIDLMAEH